MHKANSDKRWSGFIIVNTVKDPLIFKDPWPWVTGFSLGHLHMGGFVPPIWGGQVQGDKALMGGLMRGAIDLMGGPNFDRLYHKLKALLLLSCNYIMQFISYDSIKTR